MNRYFAREYQCGCITKLYHLLDFIGTVMETDGLHKHFIYL